MGRRQHVWVLKALPVDNLTGRNFFCDMHLRSYCSSKMTCLHVVVEGINRRYNAEIDRVLLIVRLTVTNRMSVANESTRCERTKEKPCTCLSEPSSQATTSVSSCSGCHRTQSTQLSKNNRCNRVPFVTLQTTTLLSSDPLASCEPSGEKVNALMVSVWPSLRVWTLMYAVELIEKAVNNGGHDDFTASQILACRRGLNGNVSWTPGRMPFSEMPHVSFDSSLSVGDPDSAALRGPARG